MHWKDVKIKKLLGNDGVRDYYLCEGDGVFAVQDSDDTNLGQYIGKLGNIKGFPWIPEEVVNENT